MELSRRLATALADTPSARIQFSQKYAEVFLAGGEKTLERPICYLNS